MVQENTENKSRKLLKNSLIGAALLATGAVGGAYGHKQFTDSQALQEPTAQSTSEDSQQRFDTINEKADQVTNYAPTSKVSEYTDLTTINCNLTDEWRWNDKFTHCDNITMDVDMISGHGLEYTLKNKYGVPAGIVETNVHEMQDNLLTTGQLNTINDRLFVDYSGEKGEWKFSNDNEDCGDGLNDDWSANTTYKITFTPNNGPAITKEANSVADAIECGDCESTYVEPQPILEPTPEPVPQPIPEPQVVAPKEEELVPLQQADLYCVAENLSLNNAFPHTYTRGSNLREEAKDMGLDAVVGQLSNDWVVHFPTNHGFALLDGRLNGETTTAYFDFDADGVLDNKLTQNIDYDNGQPDAKDTFRRVFKNMHDAVPMSDIELNANQNRFADTVNAISNSPEFTNCEYIIEPAPEHVRIEPVIREPTVIHEEPRIVYEQPTTVVHRPQPVYQQPVFVQPRGFQFHASYSRTRFRGYGNYGGFQGHQGFYGNPGFQHHGFNRGFNRPVRPFLDFRGSIRHGGPSPSDRLNHRLGGYRGY